MDVGVRIREARKAQKLTQAEVAQKAGIAINSLRLYEAGKRQPRLEQLRQIALALGTAVSELVDPDYWSTVTEEEWRETAPQNRLASPKTRITTALGKLNDAGMEKAADAVEVIAEVPRYKAGQATSGGGRDTPVSQESKDTTPPPDVSEGAQEGQG